MLPSLHPGSAPVYDVRNSLISFIEYVIPGKLLWVYANLFSPNDYQKNDKIIHKCFKDKYDISLDFRFKKDETRNKFIEEMKKWVNE